MNTKKEIGLFFGSFNPIHVGHMLLANYMVECTSIAELWFVVSPQNPHKERKTLRSEVDRYDMVDIAIDNDPRFRVSNIEFTLPKPSYTVDTLARLEELYPDYQFSLIMGRDNLASLHKWKNAEAIVNAHKIYVYPRPSYKAGPFDEHPNIHLVEAPEIEISASFIRQSIAEGKNLKWYVPAKVWDFIDSKGFYKI